MSKGFRRALVVLLSVVLVAAVAVPVLAKGRDRREFPAWVKVSPDPAAADVALKLRPFTKFTNSGIIFDKEGATKAGVPAEAVQRVATMYATVNVQLPAEKFDWAKLNANRARVELKQTGDVSANATGSGNYWWWRVSFTEWETQLLVKSLIAGGGTIGLYAIIAALPGITLPAAAVMGIAASALGLTAAYIDLVDWIGHSNGIYFQGSGLVVLYFWHN